MICDDAKIDCSRIENIRHFRLVILSVLINERRRSTVVALLLEPLDDDELPPLSLRLVLLVLDEINERSFDEVDIDE
ncbi:hypothetical protein QR98_0015770 [Sarcoptes scabiei]|uniref:Uncharacterized protein n=1 Tax=Sarcoptes scabiei TaxID=52283 RepID=A0A131ZWW5_SARSC|nr:hypothetical protein QR98_0015770 [Sarcoptes scabiei]